MNKFQKELERQANYLTSLEYLDCKIRVNRRNGYYAIDKYDLDNEQFLGPMFCGNYKECLFYLRGMFNSYVYARPF